MGRWISPFVASETDIGMVESADGERSWVRDRQCGGVGEKSTVGDSGRAALPPDPGHANQAISRGFRHVGVMESMAILHR